MISDWEGKEYQRIEYTPYGETWVEKTSNSGSEFLPYRFTGKEVDQETGLYYYGARYLDPKYSMWISTDPALGEYIPEMGKGNAKDSGSLPGMGGVYNHINFHLYHYAGNNPVKYTDPDGRSGKLTIYSMRGDNPLSYDPVTYEDYSTSLHSGMHSWISFTDDETGVTTYYGTWGHENGGNLGVRTNDLIEKGYSERAERIGTKLQKREIQLDDKQQKELEKFIAKQKKRGASAWGFWHPCSNFASKAWKHATGEKLRDRHLGGLGYSDPNVLADSIEKKNLEDSVKKKLPEVKDETK